MTAGFAALCLILATFVGTSPRGADDPKGTWDHELTLDVTGSQTHFDNWTAGGEDAISWTGRMKGQSRLSEPRMDWDWRYDLTYGQARRGTGGMRKTNDELHLETEIVRKIGVWVNPFVAADLRTQIDNGYRDIGGIRTRTSRIWEPGYTSASIGGGKELGGGVLAVRGGASLRQAWQGRDSESKLGAEMVGRLALPLAENTKFTNELRAFRGKGEKIWSIRNEAILRIQIAKFFTINVSAQILDDPKRSDDLQIRQATAIGLGYSLL